MASPPASSPISDRGHNQKRPRTLAPTSIPSLPSPNQSDPPDTDSALENNCKIIDSVSETIDSASKTIDSASTTIDSASTTIDSASIPKNDRKIVDEAFQTIKASFDGKPTQSYPTFQFENPSSFQFLQNQLKNTVGLSQFFNNQVRFDWNAKTGNLVLRLMLTFVHEHVQNMVAGILEKEIRRIGEDPDLKSVCEKILPGGQADITKGGAKYFRKTPDGQLVFKGTRHPTFVFEVAYSEEEKHILDKVEDYFYNLRNCTVLSLDLSYAPPSTRTAEGHAHDGAVSLSTSSPVYKGENIFIGEVEIPFQLLIPWEQRKDLPKSADAARVCIPFAELTEYLSTGEEEQRLRDSPPELSTPPPPVMGLIYRKRNGDIREVLASDIKRRKKQ
ncbi:hypothetical protein NUW58_g5793 [Xylaria curta]|uniref:Uncharacterized protein n=1 Tax=Xylaria curta TaxID=42375 RepID=A0ACC1P2K3_9PEZI|nr:hypothetical protein NUW58_g5793 [Xylaria curta]